MIGMLGTYNYEKVLSKCVKKTFWHSILQNRLQTMQFLFSARLIDSCWFVFRRCWIRAKTWWITTCTVTWRRSHGLWTAQSCHSQTAVVFAIACCMIKTPTTHWYVSSKWAHSSVSIRTWKQKISFVTKSCQIFRVTHFIIIIQLSNSQFYRSTFKCVMMKAMYM